MNSEDSGHLLERYFLGTISDSEMECLDAQLQSDAALRDEFAAMARLDTNLRAAALQLSGDDLESSDRAGHFFSRKQILIGVTGVAASIFASFFFLHWPRESKPSEIAHITELGGSLQWTGDGGQVSDTLTKGQQLYGGTLETHSADSWVKLTFLDGSELALSGRSTVTISRNLGRNVIRLREGSLSVQTTPEQSGNSMIMMTPTAEAEVLGSRFTMMADSTSTCVTVYEGQLRVTRLADGDIQEVSADHFVVAALDATERFLVLPREHYVNTWSSNLPFGSGHGDWYPGENGEPGRLLAKPLLWKEYGRYMVLHLASLSTIDEAQRTALLNDGAHVRVVGRLQEDAEVHFGLTTHRVGGGFAGKYIASQKLSGSEDLFEIDLPITAFNRQYPCFPETLIGHELIDWWALTIDQEAGLEIISVELLAR